MANTADVPKRVHCVLTVDLVCRSRSRGMRPESNGRSMNIPDEPTATDSAADRNWCDGSEMVHELGRRFQAVSVVMHRHEIVSTQQICVCGELPLRIVPIFGLRCRSACEAWDLAWSSTLALARIADQQLPGGNRPIGRISGRASVPAIREG